MSSSEATRRGFFRLTAATVVLTSITSAHVQVQAPAPKPLQGKYWELSAWRNTGGTKSNDPLTQVAYPTTLKDSGWYYVGMLAKQGPQSKFVSLSGGIPPGQALNLWPRPQVRPASGVSVTITASVSIGPTLLPDIMRLAISSMRPIGGSMQVF